VGKKSGKVRECTLQLFYVSFELLRVQWQSQSQLQQKKEESLAKKERKGKGKGKKKKPSLIWPSAPMRTLSLLMSLCILL
jgi:hypothetical protein